MSELKELFEEKVGKNEKMNFFKRKPWNKRILINFARLQINICQYLEPFSSWE